MNDAISESRMRQHFQDRRLRFELYEEEKRRVLSRFDAETIQQIRAKAKRFRDAFVWAYRCAPVADLLANALGGPDVREAPDAPGTPEAFDAPGVFAGGREELVEAPSRKKLFSEIPRVDGERIVLDRVVAADADALRDLICNAHVQRYEPTYLFEKQFDDASEAIASMYGDLFANKESLILAIRMKETGELAGLAEFYGLRDSLHKISVGYRLRECWWGYGLATEAARLMVGYLYW